MIHDDPVSSRRHEKQAAFLNAARGFGLSPETYQDIDQW